MTLAILLAILFGVGLATLLISIPLEKSYNPKDKRKANKMCLCGLIITLISLGSIVGLVKWATTTDNVISSTEEVKVYEITKVDNYYIHLDNETSIKYNGQELKNIEIKLNDLVHNNEVVYTYTEETLPSIIGIKNIRGHYKYEVYLEEKVFNDVNNILNYNNYKWENK